MKQEAQPDVLQHNFLPARAAPCDEEAKAREAVLIMRQKNRIAQRRYRERKRVKVLCISVPSACKCTSAQGTQR